MDYKAMSVALIKIASVILLALLFGWIGVVFAAEPLEYIAKIQTTSGALKAASIPLSEIPGVSVKSHLQFKSKSLATTAVSTEYVLLQVESTQLDETLQRIKESPTVVTLEPNYPVNISASPRSLNDPLIGNQDYLAQSTIFPTLEIIPRREVKVAVVDTGVDRFHPDLIGHIAINSGEVDNGVDDDHNGYTDDVAGYSFFRYSTGGGSSDTRDVHGHGTHIAGIIAAAANNHKFGSGINPSARIIPVPFMDSSGRGTQYDGAAAIRYAVDMGAEVINCSWGYYVYSGVLEDAVEYARSHGVIVVGAAGNSGSTILEYPASFDSVISVGSMSLDGYRSSFSNLNAKVDVMTYGESILSVAPGGGMVRMTGTSQAAGVVSGVISRLLSALPTKSITVDQIVPASISGQSVVPQLNTGTLIQTLSISTGDVVTTMTTELSPGSQPFQTASIEAAVTLTNVLNFPNPIRLGTTRFGFYASQPGRVNIRIFELNGRLVQTVEGVASIGQNAISWDCNDQSGTSLGNGTYLYALELIGESGRARARGKLTVLR